MEVRLRAEGFEQPHKGSTAGEWLARDHVMRREDMLNHSDPRNLQGSIADLETSPNTCHQDCRPEPHRGLQSSRRREQETQSELQLAVLSRTAPTRQRRKGNKSRV